MRKILALVLAITMLFALAVPAMAKDKGTDPATDFEFEVNNANFHCNDIEGENGRVWPNLGLVDGKSNGGNNKNKLTSTFSVTRIAAGSTQWSLNDTVVCPSCESTDWVTFSNNSGVPNGNNVQFQHTAPTKMYRYITVIYTRYIPKCEFTCKNDIDCKLKNHECPPCGFLTKYPMHDCTQECAAVHDCPYGATCTNDGCVCEDTYTEIIVDKKKVLVRIADGYLVNGPFTHEAPEEWKGGSYSEGLPIYVDYLESNTTFTIKYLGVGICKCECDSVGECTARCVPCDYVPGCNHIAVCDNCSGHGNQTGKNHGNCELENPESKTNYFCLICDEKLADLHKKHGWTFYSNWRPSSEERPYCECPTCYGPE